MMTPSREQRDRAVSMLPAMNADGLGWLTPILEDMAGGDPWQEGTYAVEIVEAWEKKRSLTRSG